MADYTSTELIARLKSKAMVPTAQVTFQNDDFLDFLNDELKVYIVPFLLSVREEYLVAIENKTIGTSTTFTIPERAIAGKLRDVLLVTSSSDEYSIPRLTPEDVEDFDSSSLGRAFYIENDGVKILGNYNSSDILRLKYFRRPNELVLPTSCALVSSVNGSSITCSSMPSSWLVTDTFDAIKGSLHFSTKGDDLTISAINTSAKTMTFDSIPSSLAVGDYICKAGESPIPQIPYELFPLLILKTAASILRSQGDEKGSIAKEQKCMEVTQSFKGLFSDRVEGENQKIVNKNNAAWASGSFWS